jgi:transcriptional regulator with XRE-family HTH domain
MELSIDGRHVLNPAAPGFGAMLRHWRLLRGLSMVRLAEMADMDYSSISRLESGSRPNPERETVTALADALELTGAHRVMLFGSAGFVEHPMTEAQASALAGWRDGFTTH